MSSDTRSADLGHRGTVARHGAVVVLLLTASTGVVYAALWTIANTDYDVWGAVLIGPVLLALTWPVARHIAATDRDPRIATLIMVALALKLLAAVARYYMTFEVYGSGDAMIYIREGAIYAEQVRQGDLSYQITTGGGVGTHFIRRITGYVFALTGATAVGGFFVFSWFGFLGMCFFYSAMRIGVPQGDHRRYALLLFLLPTLLYWPSSIGKEAWMLLTIGLGAYGAARILTRLPGGYLLYSIGLLGSAAVRPHITVLLAVGLAASFLLRRSPGGSTLAIAAKIVGGGLVIGATVFAIQATEERFELEEGGLTGAEQVIDRTAEQTSQGGSEFETARPTSPLDIPRAVFTVLFRPLPHEAHNVQALMTSLEGLFLLGLFVLAWPRLRRLPGELLRTPYLTFVCTYSLLFMLAFSSFGNFGILARQRVQLFPFVFVLLALPAVGEVVEHRRDTQGRRRYAGPPLVAVGPQPRLHASGIDEGTTPSQGTPSEDDAEVELVVDLPSGSTRQDRTD